MFLRFCADTEGQSIKTSRGDQEGGHGVRFVPVHAELLRLGFSGYVEAQRRRVGSNGQLFDVLVCNSNGSLTADMSKRLNGLLRAIGITDRRIVFHSTRHTFKHYARMCGIPKATLDALTGHETGEVGDTYGGENYPVAPLVDGMRQYRLPFLDLSGFYVDADESRP